MLDSFTIRSISSFFSSIIKFFHAYLPITFQKNYVLESEEGIWNNMPALKVKNPKSSNAFLEEENHTGT